MKKMLVHDDLFKICHNMRIIFSMEFIICVVKYLVMTALKYQFNAEERKMRAK